MIIKEKTVPFCRFLMTDQMRRRGAVLVVDEIEAKGLEQRELGHSCLIENTAAAICPPLWNPHFLQWI